MVTFILVMEHVSSLERKTQYAFPANRRVAKPIPVATQTILHIAVNRAEFAQHNFHRWLLVHTSGTRSVLGHAVYLCLSVVTLEPVPKEAPWNTVPPVTLHAILVTW